MTMATLVDFEGFGYVVSAASKGFRRNTFGLTEAAIFHGLTDATRLQSNK